MNLISLMFIHLSERSSPQKQKSKKIRLRKEDKVEIELFQSDVFLNFVKYELKRCVEAQSKYLDPRLEMSATLRRQQLGAIPGDSLRCIYEIKREKNLI